MIKTLWILWLQGFANAPELVKRCLQSWMHYNPDWNIICLDTSNLHLYVDYPYNGLISLNHYSDVIRALLLFKYGGLWVDATTFCNRSLNDWLPQYIEEGFFAFEKPGLDRLLSSWFLYSEKEHYIIQKWKDAIVHYFNCHKSTKIYYIFHYLFGDLYSEDQKFKYMWDKVLKLSANGKGPHYIQEKEMFNDITPEIKEDIDNKITPLYKLTYKHKPTNVHDKTILFYLYSTVTV